MGAKYKFGQSRPIALQSNLNRRLGDAPDNALAALRDASAALAAAGIEHWLTYGALLGFVREGHLLAHDTDIDFAVRNAGDKVPVAMEAKGFRFYSDTRIGSLIGNQKFRRDDISVDIFHLVEDGALLRDHCPFDKWSVCSGTHLRMPLAPLDCGGFSVPAPVDGPAYVEHLYGPDWRQPVTSWDWRFSPPNTTISVNWRSAPRFARDWLRYQLKR